MIFIVIFSPFLLALLFSQTQDPRAGLFTTKQDSSRHHCTATSPEANLREKNIGENASPRGSYFEEAAFRCQTHFFENNERSAVAEALLTDLDETVAKFVNLAKQEAKSPKKWSAFAHGEESILSHKIKFAIEVQLAAQGEQVDTQLPSLSATNIETLSRLDSKNVLEQSCDFLPSAETAWVGLAQLNSKETQLQGGLCFKGVWKWLL
jgi:hypothetical protein